MDTFLGDPDGPKGWSRIGDQDVAHCQIIAWFVIEFLNKEVVDSNRITQYTPDLPQSQVDTTIAQAFQIYSDVIPLDFKQIYSGTADIMIIFKGGCESGPSKRHEKHPYFH